jgi:hypothetical protein
MLAAIRQGSKDGAGSAVDCEVTFFKSDCNDQDHKGVADSLAGRADHQPQERSSVRRINEGAWPDSIGVAYR